MNKRIFSVAFVLLFLVSTLSFISAQNPLDDFAGQIENTSGRIEDTADKAQRLSREDYKWKVLSERWKEYLLKNPIVSKLDEFFKKGNIVFVILFGRDYSLSLTLIFLIVLWFYFFSQFGKIIGTFSTFSSGTSLVISLGMTIILAQVKFFDWASEMIFKFIFYREGAWGWLWSLIFIGVVILVAMALGQFFTSLKKSVLKFKDEEYRKKLLGELEQKNRLFGIFADAIRGMWKKD
jgi:hypothetical protein